MRSYLLVDLAGDEATVASSMPLVGATILPAWLRVFDSAVAFLAWLTDFVSAADCAFFATGATVARTALLWLSCCAEIAAASFVIVAGTATFLAWLSAIGSVAFCAFCFCSFATSGSSLSADVSGSGLALGSTSCLRGSGIGDIDGSASDSSKCRTPNFGGAVERGVADVFGGGVGNPPGGGASGPKSISESSSSGGGPASDPASKAGCPSGGGPNSGFQLAHGGVGAPFFGALLLLTAPIAGGDGEVLSMLLDGAGVIDACGGVGATVGSVSTSPVSAVVKDGSGVRMMLALEDGEFAVVADGLALGESGAIDGSTDEAAVWKIPSLPGADTDGKLVRVDEGLALVNAEAADGSTKGARKVPVNEEVGSVVWNTPASVDPDGEGELVSVDEGLALVAADSADGSADETRTVSVDEVNGSAARETVAVSASSTDGELVNVAEGVTIVDAGAVDGSAETTVSLSVDEIAGSTVWKMSVSAGCDADGKSMNAEEGLPLVAANTGEGSAEVSRSLSVDERADSVEAVSAPAASIAGDGPVVSGTRNSAEGVGISDSVATCAMKAASGSEISPETVGATDFSKGVELADAVSVASRVCAASEIETRLDTAGSVTAAVGPVLMDSMPAIDRADSVSTSGVDTASEADTRPD